MGVPATLHLLLCETHSSLRFSDSRLRGIVRREDIFCRWGGDEFLLFLKQSHLEQGCPVANSICQAIRKYRSGKDHNSIAVSVSIGVSQYTRGEDERKLFDRVDRALYLAKEKGRNRYESASS